MNQNPRLITGLFAALLFTSSHAADIYPDMSLQAALEELRGDGLVLVYSSDLIRPDMRVSAVPEAEQPEDILRQLIAPWGLTVQPGPTDTLLIVRIQGDSSTGRLTGQVRDVYNGAPLAGAVVILGKGKYTAITDSHGRFIFDALEPGRYRLRVDYEAISFARRARAEVRSGETTSVALDMDGVNTAALDEIIVSTSRYNFDRSDVAAPAEFTAADLEINPNVGDDPLRAVERLPGASSTDFSARANVRGGSVEENLVRLDGLRLYNPYHLKGFQGFFSAIDPRLVDRMDVYTGGFPVQYGDGMSSVIDVHSVQPEEDFYGELSASFFNLSGLFTQRFNEGRSNWLVSARRGNLDVVLDIVDPDLGKPKYFDVHARLGHAFNDTWEITANAFLVDNSIELADTDTEELAEDDYRDRYYWARVDFTPNDDLTGNLLVSRAKLGSGRNGSVEKEGTTSGESDENNNFTIDGIQTDWSWWFADDHLLQVGGEYRDQEGRYSYRDDADFELLFLTPGAPTDPARNNDRNLSIDGTYLSIYGNLRTQWTDKLTTEVGLRWNKETLSPENDSSFDPRFGLMYDFTAATRGRISVGRYSQSQTVDQLDFGDGAMLFRPLQKVDQVVGSLEHDFSIGLTARLEAYYKNYSDLRPRYENFLDTYSLLPQLWPDRVEIVADDATAEGVELTFSGSGDGSLGWWLSYAWSRAEDDYASGDITRSWDQRQALGGGLSWRSSEWEYSIAANIHDGRPTTKTALVTDVPLPLIGTQTRNDDRLGTYYSVDARVARIWELDERQRLTVFFEVRNLTNRSNDCCVLYETDDEDGPVEYATDTERQIPFFPSLGFIWQF